MAGAEHLINTEDLNTMFSMFDITHHGTISMKQVPLPPSARHPPTPAMLVFPLRP